jgi:hypothetical protein
MTGSHLASLLKKTNSRVRSGSSSRVRSGTFPSLLPHLPQLVA